MEDARRHDLLATRYERQSAKAYELWVACPPSSPAERRWWSEWVRLTRLAAFHDDEWRHVVRGEIGQVSNGTP
ncbi:MAG: hypothetical protein ACYDBQ_11740 [Thermoplasmatota archaeon]